MKIDFLRRLLLVGSIAGCAGAVQAQAVAVADNVFGLRPSASTSQQVVSLGNSKSQVIKVLGPPTKTSRFYDEIERVWGTTLYYGRNQLFFSKDRLGIIELNDARFRVGKPGTEGVRVGEVLPRPVPGKAPLAFGHFAVEYKPGKTRNLAYSAISYGNMKTPRGQVADVEYGILYDQNGRVFHIYLDQTYD